MNQYIDATRLQIVVDLIASGESQGETSFVQEHARRMLCDICREAGIETVQPVHYMDKKVFYQDQFHTVLAEDLEVYHAIGGRIPAIKRYRARNDVSLVQARDILDLAADDYQA